MRKVFSSLYGSERLFELADAVLAASDADLAELIILNEDSMLTRFAGSRVHQNVAVRNLNVGLRLRYGKRVGVAWVNSDESESLKNLAESAREVAFHSPEQDLPEPVGRSEPKDLPWAFDQETAEAEPEYLGKKVADALAKLPPYEGFGSFNKGAVEIVVANTKGLRLYHRMTDAHFSVNPMRGMASSWGQESSIKISEIDPVRVAEAARARAEMTENPADLQPGEYEVILEPLAVSEIIGFANWLGFSARAFQEGRSFLRDKMGTRVFSEEMSLWEDPGQGFPYPFDMEGIARKPFPIIENGVPVNLVYDLKCAAAEGKESTGNGVIPFGNYPYAMNLAMKPGKKTRQELISETERGILVTKLWYVNVAEPMSFTLTGMTRDGLFMVENGKVTRALKNMRFTQNMLDALRDAEIGSDATLVGSTTWYDMHLPGGDIVPSVKLRRFNFTSSTEF
ncbi:MAG: metallopeptidase TldD-related protein [candidate division WOR-3 bacterium]